MIPLVVLLCLTVTSLATQIAYNRGWRDGHARSFEHQVTHEAAWRTGYAEGLDGGQRVRPTGPDH